MRFNIKIKVFLFSSHTYAYPEELPQLDFFLRIVGEVYTCPKNLLFSE